MTDGLNKETKKKLLIALGATGGLCLLIILFAGMGSFCQDGEEELPDWFARPSCGQERALRGDAFRPLHLLSPYLLSSILI